VSDSPSPSKTSAPKQKAAPKSRNTGAFVVNAVVALPSALTAIEQFRSGDFWGGVETGGWTVLGLIPTTAPVAGSKAVGDTYKANKEGITERANWVGGWFDPGTLFGVKTPVGGAVAATYAVAESTARTVAEPVVHAGIGLGEGFARAITSRDPNCWKYDTCPNLGMGKR
jgi:hypothetical protein